ncbi:MAG: DUF4494 domain-containing protein [Chitinophagaceae bacterium]|nr:DUF4494 domain-containing protein [Chitinophagaceae bacterium]
MIRSWFNCKIKCQRENEDGEVKQVIESYLVNAGSYTEAESIIYERLIESVKGGFYLQSIAKTRISDVFQYAEGDFWFKCKVIYYSVDDETGNEKKIRNDMLVYATDVKSAYDRLLEKISGIIIDVTIPDIVQTNIIEIFPYQEAQLVEETEES